MNRLLAALLLGAVLPAAAQYRSGYAELGDSETVRTLKEHVSYYACAALEGRKAGSEGERDAAVYLTRSLEKAGAEILSGSEGDLFGMQVGGDTLTSRNVVAVVQGYDPVLRDRYIVVGARMDHLGTNTLTVDGEPTVQLYPGANGNASGLALLSEAARLVAGRSILFRRSVVFVGFGASCEGFGGSWYFLNRSFAGRDRIDAMVNLDMLGGGEGFCAYTASNNDLGGVLSALERQLLPIYPKPTAAEPFPSDHRVFYGGQVPAVYLTTGHYAEYNTPRDTPSLLDYGQMERELEYIYALVLELASREKAPAFRQDVVPETTASAISYYDCDVPPVFMKYHGIRGFMEKWVYAYLRYPSAAVREGIQGRVHVQFRIDRKGNVQDVHVAKGADPLLDEEAVRVIAASPKWTPGKVGGKTVDCVLTLPVDFILERKDKSKIGFKR